MRHTWSKSARHIFQYCLNKSYYKGICHHLCLCIIILCPLFVCVCYLTNLMCVFFLLLHHCRRRNSILRQVDGLQADCIQLPPPKKIPCVLLSRTLLSLLSYCFYFWELNELVKNYLHFVYKNNESWMSLLYFEGFLTWYMAINLKHLISFMD